MIKISSTTDAEQVDITGTPDEIRSIHERVLEVSAGRPAKLIVEASTARDPSPWDAALQSMEIRLGDGAVHARVLEGSLIVEGGAEELRGFASFFVFPDDAKPGDHAHYEYYDGNRWIRPESAALIITVR
jgi:hypothetical protein